MYRDPLSFGSLQLAKLIALVVAMCAVPNANAADTGQPDLRQDICNLLPAAGSVIENTAVGCRWTALPERRLLPDEIVELTFNLSADEAVHSKIASDQALYIQRMQGLHLFTKVTELSPCLQGERSGRRIWIFHERFTEMSGYTRCGDRTIALKVYLHKNGGTSPTAVFDDLIQRATPLLSAEQ
jgi:hypothetical protein